MDELLVVRSTKKTKNEDASRPPISELADPPTEIRSPGEVLDLLKAEPDSQTLYNCLVYLSKTSSDGESFDVRFPGPLAAQITHALVSNIVPNYWPQICEDRSSKCTKDLLIQVLRNVPGIGAILAQLKSFNASQGQGQKLGKAEGEAELGLSLIQVLGAILGDDFVDLVGGDILRDAPQRQQKPLWKDFIQLVASSRVVSTVAEAEDVIARSNQTSARSWLSSGSEYSRWLARSITRMVAALKDEPDGTMWEAASRIFGNVLSLGYIEIVVEQLTADLLGKGNGAIESLRNLISRLKPYEQTKFMASLLINLSRKFGKTGDYSIDIGSLRTTPKSIAGTAAFLKELMAGNDVIKSSLIDTAITDSSPVVNGSSALLRTILATFSNDQEILETVMEKTLNRFGNNLFIKHASILQQEATAQKLLLASGYLHRKQPMFVFTIVRSSAHTRGISNRIAASSERARWLGMIVGMAMSELIDKPENRMVFDSEEVQTDEAKWYLQLIHVDDKPGTVRDFREAPSSSAIPSKTSSQLASRKQDLKPDRNQKAKSKTSGKQTATSTILQIVELDDDQDREGDDLIPYAKPDSDASDSEEDPTLIQRNKPRPPVYIRDLMACLKETENYDRFHLALRNAATLIRRKANFGKEVIDHAKELAAILMNLNDPFRIEDFEELRQNALIALLIAKPADIAKYLSLSFFTGDYSIQQRTAILTTLGLGARELAGYKDSSSTTAEPAFPSKQLPPHLHALYSSSHSTSLDKTAATLEHTTLEPLALEAADSLAGPNALKVRTFSSRLDPTAQARRTKKIENKLAAIVAENFFFPLTGRFQALYHSYSSASSSVYFSPYLLPTFLRTLGVIVAAAGPSTLALPTMTTELWDLLLSLRSAALAEKEVATLEALLFALLMLLEVNADKERLAREHARELVETREWCGMVLERMKGGGVEGERVRMVAAGVMVRIGEVLERWRRVMVGGLMED